MNLEGLDKHIANVEEALAFLKGLKPVTTVKPTVVVHPPQEPPTTPLPPPPVKTVSEFDELKSLFEGSAWPRAVDPALICDDNNEDDKMMRAENILDQSLVASLKGQKLLDFGCGMGHVAYKGTLSGAVVSVGYDIVESGWDKLPKADTLVMTTDFEKVKENGLYDFVIMYDVLDHLVGEEPGTALEKIKSVLAKKGKVAVRTHPYSSATGTHLYKTANKAYAHLVFTNEELDQLGVLGGLPTMKVLHPLAMYRKFFTDAGFSVVSEIPIQQPVDPFFKANTPVAKRIKSQWKNSPDQNLRSGSQFPDFQMSLQFVDYLLEIKAS